MRKHFLRDANARFRRGDYEGAVELYRQAKLEYPFEWLDASIAVCERRIASGVMPRKLDPVTEVMLANEGRLELSEVQRVTRLKAIKAVWEDKSEDVPAREVEKTPRDWPKDLFLPALPESTNDFRWLLDRSAKKGHSARPGLSVIVPVFNRPRILGITLACLANQVTNYSYEVIVVDDGSADDLLAVIRGFEGLIDIKYIRQPDKGFRVSAARNLGIKLCSYDWIGLLDCDMAPNRRWVQVCCEHLDLTDDLALIGPRKYIDTEGYSAEDFLKDPDLLVKLPEVVTNNEVAGRVKGEVSVDWRLKAFKETEGLRLCDTPFRYFAGGNIAFAKKWVKKVGGFDESFSAWGGEDVEFGYRLYREGCFFKAESNCLAYHQEPPGKENETDRKAGKAITQPLLEARVPYFYRKLQPIEQAVIKARPLVSIYIPAYNCEDYIVDAVESALNQTVTDLEVVVCDDGSTDSTWNVLEKNFLNNPRVRLLRQENGGIGAASNAAVRHCRGHYIGQLDSDDTLKSDAVELCLREFLRDPKLACVYTTYSNHDMREDTITPGYNWPIYSREKLATSMIVHHFRMFSARAWALTEGFDERIENAVDYDMYLKLSAVGPFYHVNKRAYVRRLHGENTSIRKLDRQKVNHFLVANRALKEQGATSYRLAPQNPEDPACRRYLWEPLADRNTRCG